MPYPSEFLPRSLNGLIPFRLFVLLIFLAAALQVHPASAHAELIDSQPAENSIMNNPPGQVVLIFSESLESKFSRAIVYNSNGNPVENQQFSLAQNDPARLILSLPLLSPGIYTVSWDVLSAVDGHNSRGAFTFQVGADVKSQGASSIPPDSTVPIVAVVAKWLFFLTIAVLIADAIFPGLIWKPIILEPLSPESVRHPRIWRHLIGFTLIGLLSSLVLAWLAMLGQVASQGLASQLVAVPWNPIGMDLLLHTRQGSLWLGRLALAGFITWLALGKPMGWKKPAILTSELGLLLITSLGSHAAAGANPILPILVDWLHQIAMCVWLGGLIFLVSGWSTMNCMDAEHASQLKRAVVRRFSIMGLAAVCCLTISGLFSAMQRLERWDDLLTSPYGQVLLSKLVLMGVILAAAGLNLLVFSPGLRQGSSAKIETANRQLYRSMQFELAFLPVLLAAASLMTVLIPTRAPAPKSLSASTKSDDLAVSLAIIPGVVGQNTFDLNIKSDGKPLTGAKEVSLRLTAQSTDLGPIKFPLTRSDNGDYTASGSYLSVPGNWQIELVVRRPDSFDKYIIFNFKFEEPAREQPASPAEAFPTTSLSLLWLAGLGLALAFMTAVRQKKVG